MGLGLFLARTIVERIGGTLRLDSNVGRGTTAIVRLPLPERGE
jgi:two-component system sensor histidine kinase RegB